MWELPKYIRGRLSFSVQEIELIIRSICLDYSSIKLADRFIQSRLTLYEIKARENGLNDFEKYDYLDWKDIELYFNTHKFSFERQYFKRKAW